MVNVTCNYRNMSGSGHGVLGVCSTESCWFRLNLEMFYHMNFFVDMES